MLTAIVPILVSVLDALASHLNDPRISDVLSVAGRDLDELLAAAETVPPEKQAADPAPATTSLFIPSTGD